MNVIGLDVGFSATRKSSGVAQLHGQVFRIKHTTAIWTERKAVLADGCIADVTAIDAPLLSKLTKTMRKCERVFTLGKFQKRCKPGMSHIQGTGIQLRRAGIESADQFSKVTSGLQLDVGFPQVCSRCNLVEAFPNAFLGVMIMEICYESMPSLKRGKKFDWLYDQCRERRSFGHIVSILRLESNNRVLDAIESTSNHDERAALICLLTAASVAAGRYTAVGEPVGGYFFLPLGILGLFGHERKSRSSSSVRAGWKSGLMANCSTLIISKQATHNQKNSADAKSRAADFHVT